MTLGEKDLTNSRGPKAPVEIGWRFVSVDPSGRVLEVYPTTTGELAYSDTDSSRTTLSGLTFLPNSMHRFDPRQDYLGAILSLDGVLFTMGNFYPTSLSRQKDVLINPDHLTTGFPGDDFEAAISDLLHIDFSDGFVKLQQSTEEPYTALRGADPAQIMRDIAERAGFQTAIANSMNRLGADVTWDAFTSFYEIIDSLYPIAGHRPPWIDSEGFFRSIEARAVQDEAINLENLFPVAGTVTISETFLSAPNRVVVYDDQADYPLVGVWNAPASAPHSYANRGYYITQREAQQGLANISAAESTAAAIGENLTARTLNAEILPTARIDGPTILEYDDALWLIRSWSISTSPGSTMSIEATELIPSDRANADD